MPVNKDFYTLAGSSGQSTGYEIDQSIRFNDDDSSRLYRTPGSAGNRRTHTFSVWLKRANLNASGSHYFFSRSEASYFYGYYFYQDKLTMGSGSASNEMTLRTTRLFRDTSAWYHIVLILDTTQAISTERARMYINGVRETDFSSETYPSLNAQLWMNTTSLTEIGVANPSGSKTGYFDGYMTEMYFLDGYAYGPEYFGEFDDNGIWIPKAYEEGNYGTNGFKFTGADSSSFGTDESGTGNNYTVAGLAANDQVLDTPTNNFCVPNVLDNYYFAGTFADGNLKLTSSGASGNYTFHTTSMKMPETGKWYAEVECDVVGSGVGFGITEEPSTAVNSYIGNLSTAFAYYSNGQSFHEGGSSFGDSFTSGDIIGIAVDMDNKKIYYSKNGVFQASGNPAGNSNGLSIDSGVTYFFAANDDTGAGTTSTWIWNFGQGGTNTDGNKDSRSIGNFKYSVPSGYLALCTKNLFNAGG